MFTYPNISAVICTIGGMTFTELLPALVADTALHKSIRDNPKIFVGYSDTTGFHWFLHALTGLRTFYGPGVLSELGQAEFSTSELPDGNVTNSPVHFSATSLFSVIAPDTTGPNIISQFPRSKYYDPRAKEFWTLGTR